jgi:hypothetical protein
MKERFTSEEWNHLLVLPFHLFTAIALADGEIQKEELAEFLDRTTRGALGYKDPLHKEIARGILDGDTGELLEQAAGSTGFDPKKLKQTLKEKLTSDEYQGLLGSLFIDLVNIAGASKKRKWFRKEAIDKEERERLLAIALFWDLDASKVEAFGK